MSTWYYSPDNKEKIGPLDDGAMAQAVAQGRVRADTAVFRVGDAAWQYARSFPELFALSGSVRKTGADGVLPWSVEFVDDADGWWGVELGFDGVGAEESRTLSRFFQYYHSCAFDGLPRIAQGRRAGTMLFLFPPRREAPQLVFSHAPVSREAACVLQDTLVATAETLHAGNLGMWTVDPRMTFYLEGVCRVVPAFWLPAFASREEMYPGTAAEWRESDPQPRADIYAIASACFFAVSGKQHNAGDSARPGDVLPAAAPWDPILEPALRVFSSPGPYGVREWVGASPRVSESPPESPPVSEETSASTEAGTPSDATDASGADREYPEGKRYAAFISYSHTDGEWAKWLHEKLEGYVLPEKKEKAAKAPKQPKPAEKGRRGKKNKGMLASLPLDRLKEGLVDFKEDAMDEIRGLLKKSRAPARGRRIHPVFRDQDELPTSADLSMAINDALRRSEFLLVICSPAAARSRWVNEEVRYFKSLGREARILAVVVDGEPNASYENKGGREELECFPPALRYWVDGYGRTTDQRVEPLAADFRAADSPDDKSEKEMIEGEFLRIAAGILNVGYDELFRRDHRRKVRKYKTLAGLSVLVLLAFSFTAFALYGLVGGGSNAEFDKMKLHAQHAGKLMNFDFTMGYDSLTEMYEDMPAAKRKKEIASMEETVDSTYGYVSSADGKGLREQFCQTLVRLARFHCIDKEYDKALAALKKGERFALDSLVYVNSDDERRISEQSAEFLITKAYILSLQGKTADVDKEISRTVTAFGGVHLPLDGSSRTDWLPSKEFIARFFPDGVDELMSAEQSVTTLFKDSRDKLAVIAEMPAAERRDTEADLERIVGKTTGMVLQNQNDNSLLRNYFTVTAFLADLYLYSGKNGETCDLLEGIEPMLQAKIKERNKILSTFPEKPFYLLTQLAYARTLRGDVRQADELVAFLERVFAERKGELGAPGQISFGDRINRTMAISVPDDFLRPIIQMEGRRAY